jgi:predicted hydrolase (HD superfamily)
MKMIKDINSSKKEELNVESALALLHSHMQNINLRRHCYAVGFALEKYFDYYKQNSRDLGNLTKEQWKIVGILHDADWEATKDNPEQHTLTLLKWLENYEVSEEMLNVFRSHNYPMTKLRKPQTLIEWTLECCDELTGFIVATALVMPGKKLKDVSMDSIMKKFKQREFARAVNRDQILQCEKVLFVSAEDFIKVTLNAMQENSENLGL